MKKSLILPFLMLIKFSMVLTSDFLNAQWQISQHNYPSFNEAYNLKFINQNTGFVVGQLSPSSGFILKTTDLGITWEGKVIRDEIDSNKKYSRCISICFINETTGFITGNRNYIFKTTNSGGTWRAKDAPSGQNPMIYNDIFFVNENTGYASGRAGYIIKTTDAGESWSLIYQSPHSDVVALWFANSDTGIASDLYGGIYKTTDGGINWHYNQISDHNGIFYAHKKIQFINDNTGFIIGTNLAVIPRRSIVLKTTDQGFNWNTIYYQLDEELNNGFFLNENTGFVIGVNSYMQHTTNSGLNWQNIFVTSNLDGLLGIDFINENTGFISSFFGYVYKTTNGGTVSIENEISLIPEKFKLHQNFPNPFNPTTSIKFSLPTTQYTILKVFDALGREVTTLVNENLTAGVYQYQLTTDNYQLPSGVYYYKLDIDSFGETSNYSQTRKMILLK